MMPGPAEDELTRRSRMMSVSYDGESATPCHQYLLIDAERRAGDASVTRLLSIVSSCDPDNRTSTPQS